jgi:hypothetical protein
MRSRFASEPDGRTFVPSDSAIHDLPQKRTGGFLSLIEQHSVGRLTIIGVVLYLSVAVGISGIELAAFQYGHPLVLNDKGTGVSTFAEILYFNLITILTVGYGDLHPASYGRGLAVIEAFVGVGLFSVLVAVVTLKALLPPRNTIVFSRNAFYCTEPERFLIVFVNTTTGRLGNVTISSYFKLGGDWSVRPSITAPFITQSVQTFHLDEVPHEALISRLRDGDCLRVGITAGLGFSNFSTSVQYSADRILVIPNRAKLIQFFEPRWNPDFKSSEFIQMFHDGPEKAVALASFVSEARGSSKARAQ